MATRASTRKRPRARSNSAASGGAVTKARRSLDPVTRRDRRRESATQCRRRRKAFVGELEGLTVTLGKLSQQLKSAGAELLDTRAELVARLRVLHRVHAARLLVAEGEAGGEVEPDVEAAAPAVFRPQMLPVASVTPSLVASGTGGAVQRRAVPTAAAAAVLREGQEATADEPEPVEELVQEEAEAPAEPTVTISQRGRRRRRRVMPDCDTSSSPGTSPRPRSRRARTSSEQELSFINDSNTEEAADTAAPSVQAGKAALPGVGISSPGGGDDQVTTSVAAVTAPAAAGPATSAAMVAPAAVPRTGSANSGLFGDLQRPNVVIPPSLGWNTDDVVSPDNASTHTRVVGRSSSNTSLGTTCSAMPATPSRHGASPEDCATAAPAPCAPAHGTSGQFPSSNAGNGMFWGFGMGKPAAMAAAQYFAAAQRVRAQAQAQARQQQAQQQQQQHPATRMFFGVPNAAVAARFNATFGHFNGGAANAAGAHARPAKKQRQGGSGQGEDPEFWETLCSLQSQAGMMQ